MVVLNKYKVYGIQKSVEASHNWDVINAYLFFRLRCHTRELP